MLGILFLIRPIFLFALAIIHSAAHRAIFGGFHRNFFKLLFNNPMVIGIIFIKFNLDVNFINVKLTNDYLRFYS
jgi:hypothetical protein